MHVSQCVCVCLCVCVFTGLRDQTVVALLYCSASGEYSLKRTQSLPRVHGFCSVSGQKSSCNHFSLPSTSRTRLKCSRCSLLYTHTSDAQDGYPHWPGAQVHCCAAFCRWWHTALISWTTRRTISLADVSGVTRNYKQTCTYKSAD